MKKILNEALEFFSFILLMAILGLSVIIYAVFFMFYWMYAKLTGQEHLIK